MPPKAKKGAEAAAPPAAPACWECPECAQENEAADAVCCACDAPRPAPEAPGDDGESRFAGYAVGPVLSCEAVAGKDRLQALSVDVGAADGRALAIVTNASNVEAGVRVVVAKAGSRVPDGSGGELQVKKTSVGGVVSEGMLCDPPMLGWVGGGAGNAALVPDSFALGAPPPDKRPRLDGK